MTDTKPQHLLSLTANDTLCLKAVHIDAKGKPVIIGGKNASGKSAVLQMVRMCVAGAKEIPDNPVRRGAKNAMGKLETEDFIMTRSISTDGKQKFELLAKKGGKVTKPQTFLDSMRGKTAFDPLAFADANRHDQRQTMRDISGTDTTEVDEEIGTLESQRTTAHQDAKRAKGAMESSIWNADAPKEETSIAELTAKLQAAQETNVENADARRRLADMRKSSEGFAGQIKELQCQIEELQEKLIDLQKQRETLIEDGKPIAAQVKKLVDEDVDSVAAEIQGLEGTNKKARENSEHLRLTAEFETLADKHSDIQAKLEGARAKRHAMIEVAEFPVEGLGFDDDGVTYNDLPFDAASRGEKMRISTAIGIAEARKQQLQVMLIDNAEALDDENLAMVLKMAAEAGVQPIIARRGDNCTIVLEDGEVV